MSLVKIDEKDLRGLIADSLELQELDYAGVNNWHDYEETNEVTEKMIDQSYNALVSK